MNSTETSTYNTLTVESKYEESGDENSWAIFVICEIISCLLFIITLYVLLSMIAYGLKVNKWKSSRKSDVNSGMIYTAAVISVALTIPRHIVNQVIFNVSTIPSAAQICEQLMDIGNGTYFCAMYSIYFFLWLRQRALYGHPAMRRLAGRCLSIFSWVTVFGLSAAAIGVCLFFIVPDNYTYAAEGCVIKESVVNVSQSDELAFSGSYYSLIILLVVAQIALLCLFIYPMLRTSVIQNDKRASTSRQSSKMSLSSSNDDSIHGGRKKRWMASIRQVSRRLSSSSTGKTNSIQKTIRRSIVCAAVSLISDTIATAIVLTAIPKDGSRALSNTVYDIGTTISVLCVLGTFESYKKILTVFCGRFMRSEKEDQVFSSVSEDTPKFSDKFRSISTHELPL